MYEEYEDIIKPSEVRLIIDKALVELSEHFTDEAKAILNKVSEARNELDRINIDIRIAKSLYEKYRDEISREKQAYENAKEYQMPKEYIDRFVGRVTKGFVPGDICWEVIPDYKWVECGRCYGKGELTVALDGESIQVPCPVCRGDKVRQCKGYKVQQRRISSVRLSLGFYSDSTVEPWETEGIKLVNAEYWIDVSTLFHTKEEAEEEVKRLTQEESK